MQAVEALQQRNQSAARLIILNDQRINEKRYALEIMCITLIATQQPMARDLRLLAAILEIITELERIGDYAKGISRITLMIGNQPLIIPIEKLVTMRDLGLDMLRRALKAFLDRDVETARKIPEEDDQVDALYVDIYRQLIQKIIDQPTIVDQANHIMWAAHNLERLADRVTNICERTVYVVTGQMKEFDVLDNELTT